MTLSRFLRDYLYIALGGNRRGTMRRYVNLIVTMLLGGLWHGAAWTFVLWGAAHGALLAINHGWLAVRGRLPAGPDVAQSPAAQRIGAVLTFLAIFGAWAIFRADDLPSALRILRGLAGLNGHSLPPSALVEVGEAARWIGQAQFVPSSLGRWFVAHFGAVDAGIPERHGARKERRRAHQQGATDLDREVCSPSPGSRPTHDRSWRARKPSSPTIRSRRARPPGVAYQPALGRRERACCWRRR